MAVDSLSRPTGMGGSRSLAAPTPKETLARSPRSGLVFPKPVEPIRCQLGVPDRVLDVFVSQVVLDRSSVVAVIRQLEPAGMAQHMRMNRKPKSRQFAGTGDNLTNN